MDNPLSFIPHPLLRNPHAMTILPALDFGRHSKLHSASESVLVDVADDSKIRVHYHRCANDPSAPTLLLVHGLESSAASPYLLNLTAKALPLGFNVVRMNLRNCGGTMKLSPGLYNAGMSGDVIKLVDFVHSELNFSNIFLVGYSLGGNIVLKAAAELGARAAEKFSGVCTISPALDLNACVVAIESGVNRLYEFRFLLGLKAKIEAKNKLFPGRFDASKLKLVKSLRAFDDTFTSIDAGYANAMDYYSHASALPMLSKIQVPTLIIAAQDDPIVPFHSFREPQLNSPFITLLAPTHGGHGGFVQQEIEQNKELGTFDRSWAENRVLEFCLRHIP
jgi:predicted alpha/beta-fold hydrolase